MESRKIRKLLVANRGEIALRVIRACRELGIRTVAVFSDADRRSLHVLSADEAYPLGGSTPKESYLNQSRIIEIATISSADAIHPGYGFLAENPAFADAVEEAGLLFVGPSGTAIRRMGDKTEARKVAKGLGIPTISGTMEPLQNSVEGSRSAAEIGYPVLLKAAAGGGGKGMRVVRSEEEFDSAYRMAQSEAKGAFGDDRVYLEKYLGSPRHIEMQVIADSHGNVVYLGERECSIQRRHQKVIEESPSTAVDDTLRKQLGEAAVRLVKTSGIVNAGTLEFLLDSEGNFFFLEMNTRLQVEHPVTEATTGLDLVKLQIEVAEGKRLPFDQTQLRRSGHSIECRVCAEDPENSFMPSTGILARYQPPQGNIRVENGFVQGDEISVFYDSLMAKVISWGATRREAIASMDRALSEFVIEGVKSTIPFCRFVLNQKDFVDGNINTRFIDTHLTASGLRNDRDNENASAAISALLILLHRRNAASQSRSSVDGDGGKWRFEQEGGVAMTSGRYVASVGNSTFEIEHVSEHSLVIGGKELRFDLKAIGNGSFSLILDNESFVVELVSDHARDRDANGLLGRVVVVGIKGKEYPVLIDDERSILFKKFATETRSGGEAHVVRAPMPGLISRIEVNVGEEVHRGQGLLVLEAMKMENEIRSIGSGRVKAVHIEKGNPVEKDAPLITIEKL